MTATKNIVTSSLVTKADIFTPGGKIRFPKNALCERTQSALTNLCTRQFLQRGRKIGRASRFFQPKLKRKTM